MSQKSQELLAFVHQLPSGFAYAPIYVKGSHLQSGKESKGKTAVPFLVSPGGVPITALNGITRILNKIFGKKIGSSMLRTIF